MNLLLGSLGALLLSAAALLVLTQPGHVAQVERRVDRFSTWDGLRLAWASTTITTRRPFIVDAALTKDWPVREAYGSLENLVARFGAVEGRIARGGDSSNRIGFNEADGVSPLNPITADAEQVAGLRRTMGRNIGTITAPVQWAVNHLFSRACDAEGACEANTKYQVGPLGPGPYNALKPRMSTPYAPAYIHWRLNHTDWKEVQSLVGSSYTEDGEGGERGGGGTGRGEGASDSGRGRIPPLFDDDAYMQCLGPEGADTFNEEYSWHRTCVWESNAQKRACAHHTHTNTHTRTRARARVRGLKRAWSRHCFSVPCSWSERVRSHTRSTRSTRSTRPSPLAPCPSPLAPRPSPLEILISQQGSGMPLHMDGDHSHFWALQLMGRKTWVICPTDLGDHVHGGKVNVFGDSAEERERYASYFSEAQSECWRVTVEPGEILYWQSHWWHATHVPFATEAGDATPAVTLMASYLDDDVVLTNRCVRDYDPTRPPPAHANHPDEEGKGSGTDAASGSSCATRCGKCGAGSLFPNEETAGGGGNAPIAPGGVVPGQRERPEDPAWTSCVTSPAVCYAEVFDPNGHGNPDLEQKLVQCKDTWRKAAVKRREAGVVEGRERRERRERSK